MTTPQERAARLLRWYPKAWRHRYGEEFAELLIADIEERPASFSRAVDVARAGVLARLAMAGLAEPHLAWQPDPARRVQVSLGPLLVLAAAVSLLAFGGHHFLYQWPGSGGQGEGGTLFPVIPAGLQAFAWSLTYWFSAHWFWLATGLGGWEIAWIAASPLALAAAAAAAASLVRRAELSPRLLAYETRLAATTCAVTGVFLGGCGYWVYVGRSPGLAHAGVIDIAAAVLLALALAAAYQAQRTALRGLHLVRN